MARSSTNIFTTPFLYDKEDILEYLTPIELPTDEEIKEGLFHRSNEYAIGFKDAIEYIKQQYK